MRIFLSGPMGSGKTTVAKAIARRASRPLVDLDQCIEQQTGRSVSELFAERGESAFRGIESDVLRQLVDQQPDGVFALGGGAVVNAATRRELLDAGLLVTLRAPLGELVRRVGAAAAGRPLLAGQDVGERLATLLRERAAAYAECHVEVETEGKSPDELAAVILDAAADPPIVVALGERTYRVEVGNGVRARLTERLTRSARGRGVVLVSDERVAPLHAEPIAAQLEAAGRKVTRVVLPSGEEHKTLASVERIWTAALGAGIDRSCAVVALGGGVVGDLSGFAASTLLRGIVVGHLPTTLLAMVDAAVGGKTGFDSSFGKNLIGTFHQPSFVLCDADFLATLPARERTAGLAEVAKSAWIDSEGSVAQLERDCTALAAGDGPATLRAIHMSARLKVRVVSQDERESDVRALLNLGHTLGHAIEASEGYQGMRHGEAVALGMVAAFKVSERLGHAAGSDVERAIALLRGLGLPTQVQPYLHSRVFSFISSDKKRSGDRVTFILPGKPGQVQLRSLALPELLALLADLDA